MSQPLRFSAFIFGVTILLAGCASHPGPSLAADSPAPALQSTDSFSPEYEFAGHWLVDGDPIPAEMIRHGKQIAAIYNNSGYQHVFTGNYVNATTIVGIQTRLKLADHTTTRMRLTDTFLSPDSIRVDWVALDSNSDLAKGQTGVGFLQRVPATDAGMNGVEDRSLTTDSPAPALQSADDFSPEYEYAGHWTADGDPTPSDVTRQGRHVVSIYNNSGYKHVFVGDYVNATTIKGIQTRCKRADQTTTRMRLTLTFLSPNSIRVDWIALDSNSDLTKGQTGVSMIQRVPAADTGLRGVD